MHLINSFKKKSLKIKLLLSFLFILCIGYFAIFFKITDGIYIPLNSDENMYFLSTKLFHFHKTLEGAVTFGGKGAILFGADAHGFAYPLLHGVFGFIFGFQHINFIIINLLCICIIFFIVYKKINISIENKILFLLLLLMSFNISKYTFSFMQENLNVLFLCLLTFTTYKLYHTLNKRYIFILLAMCLIMGLFRPLWLYWSVVLIPFNSKKWLNIKYLIIFLFIVILSAFYIKYKNDHVPKFFSKIMDEIKLLNFNNALSLLILNIKTNIISFFKFDINNLSYTLNKYMTVGITFILFFLGIKKKDKFITTISFIGLIFLLLLFSIYEAFPYRDLRSIGIILIAYYFVILTKNIYFLKPIVTVFCIIAFLFSINETKNEIIVRKNLGIQYINSKEEQKEYNKILELTNNKKATILFDYIPAYFDRYKLDISFIPIGIKQPISYIIRYYEVEILPENVDYIISKPGYLEHTNFKNKLLYKGQFFDFYKILK